MPAKGESEPKKSGARRPPATTPESRERQLVSLSIDLAETQLRDGTASAQVMTHFLKLGSSREMLEQERLQEEIELQKVKREMMKSAERIEELYDEAIKAMRAYSGQAPSEPAEDDVNE
jgi:hypothetical protein